MARKARCFEEGGFTYSGSEEDAMATAKRRMAERDAEYAAANPPKPAAPKAAASKPRFRAAPYPEDSPAKNPNVRAMRVPLPPTVLICLFRALAAFRA
jgi:hypothetical protein